MMAPDRIFTWRTVAMAWMLGGMMTDLWSQSDAALEAELTSEIRKPQATDPLRSESLSFLHPTESVLFGEENLGPFLKDWHALLLDQGPATSAPLNLLHFGGSHVQAGRIGWAFRQRLQADRPGLTVSRGILPPHRLVGENGPPGTGWDSPSEWRGQRSAHRRHSGQWGLTGLEASAEQGDTLRVWTGKPAGESCASSLMLLTRPGHIGHWSVAGLERPFHADSSGVLTVDLEGEDLPDTLLLIPPAGETAYVQGVARPPMDPDLIYHDLGGNGASSAAWLRHPHLVPQLREVGADLAILAWGINDAHMAPERFNPQRFKQRYARIIDSLRMACPDVCILLVTNNDSHYKHRHNPNAEAVKDVMLDLVIEKKVACWDLYEALGGAHSMDQLYREGMAASDRLHFNRDGYILIGELLYDTLTRAAVAHESLTE